MSESDNIHSYGIYSALHELFDKRGFNFKEFGMTRIQQKLSGRMSTLEIPDLHSYIEYIKLNPQEFTSLFDCLLINQNQFFSNPEAYNYIKTHVIPKILLSAKENKKQEIRIWSVGCGSGEEPYSVAILISEVLKDNLNKYKIKIFATDINESAIKIARSRNYLPDRLINLPDHIKNEYFTKHGNLYTVSDKIRDMIIFGKHNIISDPPIPYVDLLICRNVLIYLEPIPRLKAIDNICNALNYNGYLWMELAENHITKSYYGLKPLSTKWHIFKKVSPNLSQNNNLLDQLSIYTTKKILNNIMTNPSPKLNILLLDYDYKIIYYDQNISSIFSQFDVNSSDIDHEKKRLIKDISGKSIFDLYISNYIPDLKSKLNNTDNIFSVIDDVEYWINKDERILLKIIIIHLKDIQLGKPCFILIFLDITDQYELNNELKTIISVLDIANKKLFSTNEELKSMAKGLETINQYLQSTNTEEFIELNEKLIRLNADMNALKESYALLIRNIDSGIIVVDKKLSIKTMNSIAMDILNIKDGEIIKSLSEIDIELAKLANQVIQIGAHKDHVLRIMNKDIDVSINPIISENNLGLFLILNERMGIQC